MSDTIDSKPLTSFWIIGGFALVWNLLGLFFYYGSVTTGEETLSQMTEAQRQFFLDMPTWATSAYAVAVTAGVLGSILLLLRKSLAVPLFALSLLGIVIQNLHAWVLADGLAVFGAGNAVLPVIVILIAIGLIVYSNKQKSNGTIS